MFQSGNVIVKAAHRGSKREQDGMKENVKRKLLACNVKNVLGNKNAMVIDEKKKRERTM